MGLSRLIYTSSATNLVNYQEIYKILDVSQKLNEVSSVTGILYYSRNYFMQHLEGEWSDIDTTYQRIERDKRHKALRVLVHGSIAERVFGDWSMAYIPEAEILSPLHENFTSSPEFNPESITPELAINLVQELKAQLPKAHYAGQNI